MSSTLERDEALHYLKILQKCDTVYQFEVREAIKYAILVIEESITER